MILACYCHRSTRAQGIGSSILALSLGWIKFCRFRSSYTPSSNPALVIFISCSLFCRIAAVPGRRCFLVALVSSVLDTQNSHLRLLMFTATTYGYFLSDLTPVLTLLPYLFSLIRPARPSREGRSNQLKRSSCLDLLTRTNNWTVFLFWGSLLQLHA